MLSVALGKERSDERLQASSVLISMLVASGIMKPMKLRVWMYSWILPERADVLLERRVDEEYSRYFRYEGFVESTLIKALRETDSVLSNVNIEIEGILGVEPRVPATIILYGYPVYARIYGDVVFSTGEIPLHEIYVESEEFGEKILSVLRSYKSVAQPKYAVLGTPEALYTMSDWLVFCTPREVEFTSFIVETVKYLERTERSRRYLLLTSEISRRGVDKVAELLARPDSLREIASIAREVGALVDTTQGVDYVAPNLDVSKRFTERIISLLEAKLLGPQHGTSVKLHA